MKNYRKLVAGLVFGWFVFAVAASAWHLFLNPANRVGVAVAAAAVVPIVIFSVWLAASGSFRRFTLSLNPRVLTLVQSWRVLAVVFLILEARGVLPAIFALPAGYGDIAVGITAPLAALWLALPRHRRGFIAWQVLGMADLLTAVGLGATAPLLSPGSIPMVALTVLPLSLIPTFLVPLMLVIHLICIAQARSWQAASETPHAAALSRS
jgi:hypothetical protein